MTEHDPLLIEIAGRLRNLEVAANTQATQAEVAKQHKRDNNNFAKGAVMGLLWGLIIGFAVAQWVLP